MNFFDSSSLAPYDGALMPNDLLPSHIDVRKLTVKGAKITSNFKPDVLNNFYSLLANNEGSIIAELDFFIDESRKRRIDGHVEASVNVVCQRCLEPVLVKVESDFKLGIVWNDDQAKQLTKTLEPIIVGEELIDLADIVEEELILSLPIVSYHDEGNSVEGNNCQKMPLSFGEPKVVFKEKPKKNPFKVLEQLKSGK